MQPPWTNHPVRQVFWGKMEVFVDTIIMCTATALVINLTGTWKTGKTGASLTIQGFSLLMGVKAGSAVVAFCMALTAYDTNIAGCFYGETCAAISWDMGVPSDTPTGLYGFPSCWLGRSLSWI